MDDHHHHVYYEDPEEWQRLAIGDRVDLSFEDTWWKAEVKRIKEDKESLTFQYLGWQHSVTLNMFDSWDRVAMFGEHTGHVLDTGSMAHKQRVAYVRSLATDSPISLWMSAQRIWRDAIFLFADPIDDELGDDDNPLVTVKLPAAVESLRVRPICIRVPAAPTATAVLKKQDDDKEKKADSSSSIDTIASVACALCYYTWDRMDHSPRVMGCGHSVCCECASKLVEKKGWSSTQGYVCPFCQHHGAVATYKALPVNFQFIDLVDDIRYTIKPSKEEEEKTSVEDKEKKKKLKIMIIWPPIYWSMTVHRMTRMRTDSTILLLLLNPKKKLKKQQKQQCCCVHLKCLSVRVVTQRKQPCCVRNANFNGAIYVG
jgi:hypothetical protein